MEFSDGFTAITGETGAGKSIIIDAIEFCLGKFQAKSIKKNKDKNTEIKLYFCLKESENIERILGFKIGDSFSVTKTIDALNKTIITVNNKQISNKSVKILSEYLINIISQFDTILNKGEYLDILDKFAVYKNKEIGKDFQNISDLYLKIQDKSNDMRLLEEKIKQFDKNREYNINLIKDLENIEIKENEETELLIERSEIQKSYFAQNLINTALELIDSAPIEQKLTQAIRQIEKAESESLRGMGSRLNDALMEISDIVKELIKIRENSQTSENEIEKIDDRISIIRNLARKYNAPSGTLFEFLVSARKNAASSDVLNKELVNLKEELNALSKNYDDLSEILSSLRKSAAEELSSLIKERFKELQMENTIFEISVNFCDEKQTIRGKNEVEFLANFNENSNLMPISEIASGGEAARLNFALKTVLSVFGNFKTIIFDEVDLGIGGSAAYSMGQAMRKISEEEKIQVVSITHSPQTAARANSHIAVRKTIDSNRIKVFAENLSYENRIQEIARMISGASINENAVSAAKKLLE